MQASQRNQLKNKTALKIISPREVEIHMIYAPFLGQVPDKTLEIGICSLVRYTTLCSSKKKYIPENPCCDQLKLGLKLYTNILQNTSGMSLYNNQLGVLLVGMVFLNFTREVLRLLEVWWLGFQPKKIGIRSECLRSFDGHLEQVFSRWVRKAKNIACLNSTRVMVVTFSCTRSFLYCIKIYQSDERNSTYHPNPNRSPLQEFLPLLLLQLYLTSQILADGKYPW